VEDESLDGVPEEELKLLGGVQKLDAQRLAEESRLDLFEKVTTTQLNSLHVIFNEAKHEMYESTAPNGHIVLPNFTLS